MTEPRSEEPSVAPIDGRILVVCAANRCRSPIGAALLARRAAQSGAALAVASAGVAAHDGEPPVPFAVTVLREGWQIDIAAHRSRRVGRQDLEDVDVVIGVERWIAKEVVLLSKTMGPRTFTLCGLARVAASNPRVPCEPFNGWLRRLDEREPLDQRLQGIATDDIADPVTGRMADYRRTAREIDRLVDRVVQAMSG